MWTWLIDINVNVLSAGQGQYAKHVSMSVCLYVVLSICQYVFGLNGGDCQDMVDRYVCRCSFG